MGTKVSEHFGLAEFLPTGMDESSVPKEIVANIEALVVTMLEPLRQHFGVPVAIHSGWRLPDRNAAVGGEAGSDHLRGAAADFHVWETEHTTWEENTIAAFDWLRVNKNGEFGQLILEDRRAFFRLPGKLCVHVSLKSAKHGGVTSDRNRLLVSYIPRKYGVWKEANFA